MKRFVWPFVAWIRLGPCVLCTASTHTVHDVAQQCANGSALFAHRTSRRRSGGGHVRVLFRWHSCGRLQSASYVTFVHTKYIHMFHRAYCSIDSRNTPDSRRDYVCLAENTLGRHLGVTALAGDGPAAEQPVLLASGTHRWGHRQADPKRERLNRGSKTERLFETCKKCQEDARTRACGSWVLTRSRTKGSSKRRHRGRSSRYASHGHTGHSRGWREEQLERVSMT